MSGRWMSEKALAHLRKMPRVGLNNLTPPVPSAYNMEALGKYPRLRGSKTHGFGRNGKGMEGKGRHPPIGFEYLRTPMAYKTQKEKHYNYGFSIKRQYPPLSLKSLQLMIDTGRVDPSKPIDLAAICNSKVFRINPRIQHFGVNLTDEGVDNFKAKINIEVQWTNEQAIAAVERNGGVITTAYYDIVSVTALSNPVDWFKAGKPIPRRLLPPQDCVEFYSNPVNRGYLADPRQIAQERQVLGQKYGYDPFTSEDGDDLEDYLTEVKDPKQVFYGLDPGSIVDLKDKAIYKPVDEELKKYYNS